MAILKKLSERLSRLIRKRPIIVLTAVLTVLGLISAMIIIKRLPEKKREVIPFVSPSPTPVEKEIITPSTYATDSAILAIEEELKILEKDLLKTDLYETGLNPPVLDMEIEFEE